MGCDIHAYIEYKEHDKWYLFASLRLERHIKAFDLMALDNPMLQLRGVPNDMGYELKSAYHGDDEYYELHHKSWLFRSELTQIAINVEWKQLDAILLATEALDVRGDHTRLVFWFDN